MSIPLKLKEIDFIYFLCKSALPVFFIADAINKILYVSHANFYRVSILFRSVYEVLFLLVILLFLTEVRILFLRIFIILFALFLAGQILLSVQLPYDYDLKENISLFNKYFFVFIIYYAIYKIVNFPDRFQSIVKWMENLFLINSIITILAYIFHLTIFRTYTNIDRLYRYGYSGVIPAQNESTLFFFLSVSYFYYQYFILKKKSINFFIVLFSSFLVGTKGVYVFLAMLLLFHFLNFSTLKSKIATLIVILTVIIGGYFYLQTEHSKALLDYYIYGKNKYGWTTMIFSGRNFFLETKGVQILENWTIVNYFIGGQDQTKLYMEMDFLDLFFFFGIIGCIIYFSLYFTTLFRFNLAKPFNLFYFISFLTLAFFGGHFFASAVNSLYLCLFSMYLHDTQKSSALLV